MKHASDLDLFTVFHFNEDGEASAEIYERGVFEARLNENYFGDPSEVKFGGEDDIKNLDGFVGYVVFRGTPIKPNTKVSKVSYVLP